MRKVIILLFLSVCFIANGQKTNSVKNLQGEKWWGGAVTDGVLMPYGDNPINRDLFGSNFGNQCSPLLLSNKGRYIWCEKPIKFIINNSEVIVDSRYNDQIYIEKPGTNLKEAYLAASKKYFPPSGKKPDELLFSKPQYNTWIELIYNQNQADILAYARAIKQNGFPVGVLMIDDNWQEDYGKWSFHPSRFPDPKAMIDELHSMGFKVMLWVCPFVSPDCDVYRELRDKKLFLMAGDSLKTKWKDAKNPAMIGWWNGYSAELDLSNPDAVNWFKTQLKTLQTNYGVDGYKLDAGDTEFYVGNSEFCTTGIIAYDNSFSPNDHTEAFCKIGLDFSLNEYRAAWKMGGQPLAQRLRDKAHNWEDMKKLIPDITVQGLLGYNFTCPDMIGGGDFSWFLPGKIVDQEIVVRSTQCHVFMPMMQFSAAPWRVLNTKSLEAVKKAVDLRMKFTPMILALVDECAISGEPIVRNMEYVFPGQGYENIKDQFMLGNTILIAPVLEKGVSSRTVILPKGKWKTPDGKTIKGGGKITVNTPLDFLPYYEKI